MTRVNRFILLVGVTLVAGFGCGSEDPSRGQCPSVQAPVGGTPDFGADESLYISMDRIKAALDQDLRFVFIDARPGGDFQMGHIPGSISLPFFDAELCASLLPKDVLYVAYCACPHAESGIVAKAINAAGGNAKILDEGYIAWKQAGYPVTSP
ncbi:MAG TPA: hypothetical protein DCQ06_13000 [Myxococcales bacterium]|nr:hypothetical protein [Myxococcales bacterium]HAN32507.1 hypothetical protein [Myxococcales bacterium]